MGKTDFFKNCVITTAGRFPPQYTPEAFKRWIEARKGVHSTSLTEETTHVVVAADYWERQGGLVVQALKRNDVKIVSLDWLVNSLRDGRKHGMAQYEWSKLDKKPLKKSKHKPASTKKRKASKGHYANALLDHTKQFAGSADASRDETPAEEAVVDGEDANAQKRVRKTFKRGAKTAKFDLLTDTHHVYQDNTGFRYEVVLTKLEISKNWTERAVVTVYESNSTPHTYACHFKSNNSLGLPDAETPRALGANFDTAMSQFKIVFEEKTGIAWDDRFEKCARRTPGRPAPAMINNSGFITPQMVIAKGGARDPEAPPEDERLLKEFQAKLLSYRTPLEDEPQGVLPANKMDFTNWFQADAGAFDNYDSSQHDKSLDEIIGTSSNDQQTMPAAETQQYYPKTHSEDVAQDDDSEMTSATVPNSTNAGTSANEKPPVANPEDQETTPAMGLHSDDQTSDKQAKETTSESQANEQDESAIPTSQSVGSEMTHKDEAHREHEVPTTMPVAQRQEPEPTTVPASQTQEPVSKTVPAPETKEQEQEPAAPREPQIEDSEGTIMPAAQIQEQEPTAAQGEPQTENPEQATAAVKPTQDNAMDLDDPQTSPMASMTAEDVINTTENEPRTPQYEPAFPKDNSTTEDMSQVTENMRRNPEYELAFPEGPVDQVEAQTQHSNEDK
ncbi:hypothetical protein MBLNU457_6635t1 [Dothideomycetes sp. NU457]